MERSLPSRASLVALALLGPLSGCVESRPPREFPPLTTAVPAPPASTAAEPALPAPALAYPATRKVDVVDTLHGVKVPDPYRWLEDGKSDEVKEWASAQDKLARAELAKLPERDAIASRLRELFYVEAVGTPRKMGGRYFYQRRDAKKEKWIVYVRETKNGEGRPLIDPHAWSADGSVSLGGYNVSWDGKKVAYKKKQNNSDEATLYVRDVATGKDSDVDVIPGAKYASASWTPKGDGFYYTWLPVDPSIPVSERPGYAEIRFHKLGTDPKQDPVVHPKTGDPKSFLAVQLSRDGRWLFAHVAHGWTRSDVYFQDLESKPPHKWMPLAVGQDAQFSVDVHKGRFYVSTNLRAPHSKLLVVDPAKPAIDQWKEIMPERADATLDEATIVGGRLALVYMKDVTSRLEVRELDGKPVREVQLPGLGSASPLVGQDDDDEAYFSFTSFTHPTEIYETNVKTGAQKLWYRTSVPVEPSKYEVEQVFFASKDGTRIPMFVVHAKNMVKDGKAPTILYGYGGFQASQTPYFSTSIYPWLERGGVYAVANLRGGSEYGEEWHRAGMGKNKQNVFDDFIGAAELLVRDKYTSADRLVIRGGSNGGLLVGAAMVQRPDLFRVVLCGVPLLDMIRYHLYGSGKTWIEEYGSADDEKDLHALFAYSPYHHVKRGERYPSVLLLSADSDDRVDPMHARKFAAMLQENSAGGPVLLRVERNAGHGGADLVRAAVEKTADEYAFALSEIAKGPKAYVRFE